MIAWAKRTASRALIDRRGATALEYVVVMAAIIPVAVAGYNVIGTVAAALIARVSF
ncbi:MAG: hypothetical protein ICV73_14735 [Acetobacteraceae bacterium]|nr:hypothetical protein [Acetobacteraceae bacterium]